MGETEGKIESKIGKTACEKGKYQEIQGHTEGSRKKDWKQKKRGNLKNWLKDRKTENEKKKNEARDKNEESRKK